LPTAQASEWRLSGSSGKVVVLLFYPGRRNAGLHAPERCVRCATAGRYYAATGAEVVGISTDTVESHRDFAKHHDLPLRLLADVDRQVADLYGRAVRSSQAKSRGQSSSSIPTV